MKAEIRRAVRRKARTGTAMKLYHTGREEIREPDIRRGRKNADFGQGFYLTPDRDFTYRWAGTDSVVNVYELDETGLQVLRLERNEEWFNAIFYNRRLQDTLQADVVIGPIANDTIFDTFGIISSGYLEAADAMKLLMIGPEYTQVVLKTEEAAGRLRWIGVETITGMDGESRRAEQEQYQAVFAETMERILGE